MINQHNNSNSSNSTIQLFLHDYCNTLHTIDIDSNTDLTCLYNQYNIPYNAYITYNNRLLSNNTNLYNIQYNNVTLYTTCKLHGGKGGFGVQLRSTSRKNKNKQPIDNSAMRDLNGQRLRITQTLQSIQNNSNNSNSTSTNSTTIDQQLKDINNGKINKLCKYGSNCKNLNKCKYIHNNDNNNITTNDIINEYTEHKDDDDVSDIDDDNDNSLKNCIKRSILNTLNRQSNNKKQKIDNNSDDDKQHNIKYKSQYSDSDTDNEQAYDNNDNIDEFDMFSEQQSRSMSGLETVVQQQQNQCINNTDLQQQQSDNKTYIQHAHKQHNNSDHINIPNYVNAHNRQQASNNTVTSTDDTAKQIDPITNMNGTVIRSTLQYAPIDLSQHTTAHELHQYGLDHLKYELQRNKLKTGGTLSERANRLYMLKHTTYDQLPNKVKAK